MKLAYLLQQFRLHNRDLSLLITVLDLYMSCGYPIGLDYYRMITHNLKSIDQPTKNLEVHVHQDVALLVEMGLEDLRNSKGAKTRALKPVSIVDQLEFRVAYFYNPKLSISAF